MKTDLALDVPRPATVARAIGPSLRDGGPVGFDVSADDAVHVTVTAETLGALRGGTNTAMMLTRLSSKVLED